MGVVKLANGGQIVAGLRCDHETRAGGLQGAEGQAGCVDELHVQGGRSVHEGEHGAIVAREENGIEATQFSQRPARGSL